MPLDVLEQQVDDWVERIGTPSGRSDEDDPATF